MTYKLILKNIFYVFGGSVTLYGPKRRPSCKTPVPPRRLPVSVVLLVRRNSWAVKVRLNNINIKVPEESTWNISL